VKSAVVTLAVLPALCLGQQTFRPPAVPLVTSDPYLSIWSETDHLHDSDTVHWTGQPHALRSTIVVDGKPLRLMGDIGVHPMPQKSVEVTPTRSIYTFADEHVRVVLTFMTPLLPDDLKVFCRPVTYITWTVNSVDHGGHRVQISEQTNAVIAVESSAQSVYTREQSFSGLTALSVRNKQPTVLEPMGDDTRINWGALYAVALTKQSTVGIDSSSMPNLQFSFDLGSVGSKPVSRHMMIGNDEFPQIGYFGVGLLPYWYAFYRSPEEMFAAAERDYSSLQQRCDAFDHELIQDLSKVGGSEYAQIASLSYRQAIAACGLAEDFHHQPFLFTKENTSNGDIATVDVIFPMDPLFIFLCPSLAKASVVSVFDYAASPHWKFPNAPHDLGTYPQAMGRNDGGEGMPVEESANMIILADAIAQAERSPEFGNRYWILLTQWAHFLEQYGLDPEDQLCTDDFMGHLAHNANLSVKAIVALAAYGDLSRMRGDQAMADKYMTMARADAAHWMEVADAGDRSLLAFDKPGTWSQKYNLVWDHILGLDVFPAAVREKEITFYKTVMQPYGLPLDSRTHITKSDWTFWCASMADNQSDFQSFVTPVYRYLNETEAREPLADSYMTDNVNSVGFHARPVVGGIFIKMLTDRAIWQKWASRDKANVGDWAPLP